MRLPVVAGTFYPREKEKLKSLLEEFERETPEIHEKPLAGVSPHAGYIYSGKIATYTFKAIRNVSPKTLVIIGPDHVGIATARDEIAVYPGGEWSTPLGEVEVDSKLADKLVDEFDRAYKDDEAHISEHSIEVQIPFAQYFLKNFKILPIMMGDQSLETSIELGKILAKIAKDSFVLASSDMSHYVPIEKAKKDDVYALNAIIQMDEHEFYRRLAERNVNACGYGPITTSMVFAREIGAKKGKLLAYGTSSDITGDPVCVGYVSVVFE